MAGGQWQIVNFPAAAAQATASQPAPGAGNGGVNRLRSLTITLSAGANAQTPIQVVVRDGASGAGTVIWSASLAVAVNSAAPPITLSGLDLRSSVATNALTVEFTGTTAAATQQSVSASGDVVPIGYPAFGP